MNIFIRENYDPVKHTIWAIRMLPSGRKPLLFCHSSVVLTCTGNRFQVIRTVGGIIVSPQNMRMTKPPSLVSPPPSFYFVLRWIREWIVRVRPADLFVLCPTIACFSARCPGRVLDERDAAIIAGIRRNGYDGQVCRWRNDTWPDIRRMVMRDVVVLWKCNEGLD